MKTIAQQIRDAFDASGRSVQDLLDESGLDLERSSLARKLSGGLRMKTDEAEALARVLGIVVRAGRKRGAA